jgi:hypothetical protein
VAAARAKGFEVIDTVGVLDLAARRGIVELADVLARLRTTNFVVGTNFSMRCSGNRTGATRPDGRQRSYAPNSVE